MPEIDFDPTDPSTVLTAVNDVVIVKQFVPAKKGVILTPSTSPLNHNTGTVLSVGLECKSGVKVGDVVVWQVFKGQAVGHFDKERWFIRDADICGVVQRGSAA